MSDVGKVFHIGDILSITDGHLVSPRHVGGVYDILGYMTGESLFTHQLPRAMGECAPSLKAQHPDLAAVVVPDGLGSEAAVLDWLAQQVATFGESRVVEPLAPDDHTSIDPLAEFQMMRPGTPVIVVEGGDVP